MSTETLKKFNKMTITGTCPICGINLWAETDNKPAIMPCNLKDCPYPAQSAKIIQFPRSLTGNGIALLT